MSLRGNEVTEAISSLGLLHPFGVRNDTSSQIARPLRLLHPSADGLTMTLLLIYTPLLG